MYVKQEEGKILEFFHDLKIIVGLIFANIFEQCHILMLEINE